MWSMIQTRAVLSLAAVGQDPPEVIAATAPSACGW
jgi:hypothetical protein